AAHTALIDYFPRSGEPKVRINDVTYEECFRTENKMWKEALPQFKKAVDRLAKLSGGLADDIRSRADRNTRAIENYMKEWKDLKYSDAHAVIEWRDGRYHIRDLGSTNGTYVNGLLIADKPLELEDEILVGNTMLIFTERDAVDTSSTEPFSASDEEARNKSRT